MGFFGGDIPVKESSISSLNELSISDSELEAPCSDAGTLSKEESELELADKLPFLKSGNPRPL